MLPVVTSILAIGAQIVLNVIIKHPMKAPESFDVRVSSKEERADEVFIDKFDEAKDALLSALKSAGYVKAVSRFEFAVDMAEYYYPEVLHGLVRLVADINREFTADSTKQ